MLWLYLLGAVTFLIIALRRVLRRQKPLNDELYSRRVAIEHVHSGVAWVRADGLMGNINNAFASMCGSTAAALTGVNWLECFPQQEHPQIQELYRQALLSGFASMETTIKRADGSSAPVNMRIATVHDHKIRVVGHYCLTEDRTQVEALRDKLREAAERVAALESTQAAV